MKALLYKLVALLLLTTAAHAQTRTVYKQTYPTNSNTLFNLYVENAPVIIEQSKDDKIHVDLEIKFKDYSNKEIEEIINGITVNNRLNGKMIDMMIMSKTKLSHENYVLNTEDDLIVSFDDLKIEMKNKQLYKSKEALLKEIKNRKDARGSFLDKIKVKQEDGSKSDLNFKEIQTMKTQFVVKLPKQIYFKLQGRESQVFIEDDLDQRFYIDLKKGLLKAKDLNNTESALRVVDTKVEVENIRLNNLSLEDTSQSLIGSISETKCKFNGSKVEIGSVGKNNEILDYDSKIYLYNFTTDFNSLKFTGDYTELFFFDFGKKVGMKAEGDITYMVREENSNKIHSTLKVAVLERQVDKDIYGKVSAKIKNGILHVITHKDN